MSILAINELTRKFGKQEVLKGVNLQIDQPGIYAVVGPNGAGKSTLFNIISNLLKPTSGTVEVLGRKNTEASIFREVSFLKDNRVLYSYLSGYDHLAFIRTAQKLPEERIQEVVDRMQLGAYVDQLVGEYSLGMKQNLLIAMAMLNKPKLMILDEPLNGLDPTSVIKVRRLLKEMAAEGTTILISSHTLSEIDLLTDRIMFLKDGKIVEERMEGDRDRIYQVQLTWDSVDQAQNLTIDGCELSLDGNVLTARLYAMPVSEFLLQLTMKGLVCQDISREKRGSEERYMEIFPEEMAKINGPQQG
jgi:ABC-2 type transport system ATP-binding protein